MADIAERSQRIVGEWLKRQGGEVSNPDPLQLGTAFMEMTAKLMANPAGWCRRRSGSGRTT